VAVPSRVVMKEKILVFLAYVIYVCLFAKGVFCHLAYENAGQFDREKHISFLTALITSCALKEREQRKTARFAFRLPPSPSFFGRQSTVPVVFPTLLSKLERLHWWY